MRSRWLTTLGVSILTLGLASGCALTDALQDALSGDDESASGDSPSAAASESNSAPVASAGIDQRVRSGQRVLLDGTHSTDADGDRIGYIWRQIDGLVEVELEDAFSSAPQFDAPTVTTETSLTFRLTVVDGLASSTDDVVIVVEPLNN